MILNYFLVSLDLNFLILCFLWFYSSLQANLETLNVNHTLAVTLFCCVQSFPGSFMTARSHTWCNYAFFPTYK